MKPRHLGYTVLAVLLLAVSSKFRCSETVTERAHRICDACSLSRDEIDSMIDEKSRSTLSRAEEIELYYSTGKPGDDLAPCLPCVEAVLDAAGKVKSGTP